MIRQIWGNEVCNLMNLALNVYDQYVFFRVNEYSIIIPKNLMELVKLILHSIDCVLTVDR